MGEGALRAADLAWQAAFRIGFPLARVWWRIRRKPHRGALVAVHVGTAVLLLRSSYRHEWNFPGGGVRRGETAEAAARRELAEEIGLAVPELLPAGEASGIWDGRPDHVHFFALHLADRPQLHLDNREIVEARLVDSKERAGLALTGPVTAYFARSQHPDGD